jgi:heme-degrading monooxygenase HmoA
MRGEAGDNVIDFATHTVWVDEKAFREWVQSDAFKRAHQGPRPDPDMFAEPNKLELFESVL